MLIFLLFLFKSTVTAGILFAYYWLFLKDRKLNQYNRFYLLISVAVSLTVPVMHFEWYQVAASQKDTAFAVLQIMNVDNREEIAAGGQKTMLTFENVMAATYLLAAATLLVLLCLKIAWVYRLRRNCKTESRGGYQLVYTKDSKAPFSFMNNLFWREDIEMDTPTGQQIMKHELTHIKQKHSLDKLFLQVVASLLWLNPFYWLALRELSNIHEFIADEEAIEEENTEAFANMVLQSQYSRALINIIQPFFYSPIKRRLLMFSKSKKTSYPMLRRLMLLPVLCIPVSLFAFKVNSVSVNKAKKKAVVIVDAGHGGSDIGGKGVNGLLEKDLTLALTEKIIALSGEYNIEAASTRKEDQSMALENRIDVSNRVSPDLFISIHVNKHEDGVMGPDYQVFVSDRSGKPEESKVFASAMIASINNAGVKAELGQKHVGVLSDNRAPAILIECGDIDNARQMALLTDKAKQEQFCRNILSGVVRYVNSK